jgi:hypothetical protein
MTLRKTDKLIIGAILIVAAIVLILMGMGMQGCTQTMNLTPSAKYYSALKTWDDNVELYNAAYRAAPPATQAKWKAKIDPLILAADKALMSWRLAYGTADYATKEAIWKDAQKQAMALLMEFGILKVEGN